MRRISTGHVIAALAALAAACGNDPVPSGDITGSVTVQEGTLDGVFVSIPGNATLPGADGSFAFRGLPLGSYEVTATKDGYDPVRATVTVEANKAATAALTLVPRPRENRPPLLSSLTVSPLVIERGGTATATALATDPDGDALTFTWSAGDGWTVTPGEGGSATITAPANGGATTDLKVTVSDGKASVEGSVRLGTEENRAPVVASISAVPPVIAPGTKTVLVVSAADPDGDTLSFTWTAPEGWTVEGAGAQVELVAPNTWGASGIVRVKVADSAGAELEAAVGVSTPANRAPVFSSLAAVPFVVAPGGQVRLVANAVDPDGGAVTFTWSATEGWTLSADGATATIAAPNAHGKEATVTLTATDAAGAATDATLIVRTTANTPPILSSLVATPPQVRPGATTTLTASAADPDGETLTYTWTVPEGWTLEGTGAEVRVTAPDTYGTVIRVGLKVADASGAATSGELALSTTTDGGPLVQGITATPPTLKPGQSTQISVSASDPDGDELTYAWSGPDGWTITGEGAQVSVLAPATYGAVGTFRVTVSSNGASAETSIVLSTRADSTPSIASLVAQPTPVVRSGIVTLTADAADADGDTLSYAWTAPEGWTLAGTGATVTLTAPAARSVSGVARLVVTSGSGLTATAQVLVATADNRAPEITAATVDKEFIDPDATATLAVTALDRDADELSFDWAAPAGWTITGTGATVSIRAPRSADASGTVIVSVTDPLGASAIARIPVKTFANRAPAISALTLSATDVRAGAAVTATATATDADLQDLTYSWSVPAGWSVTGTGASVTLTATNSRGTSGKVSVTVSDGAGGSDTEEVSVSTLANGAPTATLTLANALALVPGAGVALTATVNDPDSDTLDFTWVAPAGWAITGDDAAVTLTPPATYGATGTVKLTVDDGFGGTVEATLAVGTKTNAAPVINALASSDLPAFAGEVVVVNADASDADGQDLEYTWSPPAGWTIVEDNGASLTLRAPATRGAAGVLSLSVSDGVGGTDTETLSLSTLANRAPTAFLSVAGPLAFEPGEEIALTLTAEDEDGDALTTDVEQSAGWTAVLDGDVVRITAPDSYGASGFVRVVVSDGPFGGQAHAELVVKTIGNEAPVITALEADRIPVAEGGRVTITATASDPDGQPVLYAWEIPDGWTPVGAVDEATLVLTAPAARGVEATVVLVVSDGRGGEDEASIDLSTRVNREPTVSLSGTTTHLTPGAITTVSASITDADGDEPRLTWRVSDESWVVEGTGSSVTVTAPAGYDSTAELELTVGDGFGGTAVATIDLSTRSAGAALITSLVATPAIVEAGGEIVITAEASNPDGVGTLTYTWTIPDGWTPVGATDGAELTLTAPATRGTEAVVELAVSNGAGPAATETVDVTTEENRKPEVSFVFAGENLEPGDVVDGEAIVTDLDGDEVQFAWSVAGPFEIEFEDGYVVVGAPDAFEAEGILTLVVDDGFGGIETFEYPLSTRANVAPTIASLVAEPALVASGATVTLTASADDADGHTLTYTWTIPDGWTAEGAANAATLVLRAPATRGTEASVTVRVTDGHGGSDEAEVDVATVPNNDPTVTITGPSEPVAPGSTFELTAIADDPDTTDELTFAWLPPAGWTIAGEGSTVTVTAPNGYSEEASIEVVVTDGHEGSATTSFNVTTRDNVDPVITSVTATPSTVHSGETFVATVEATDDETELTYTWEVPEGWSVSEPSGATVTITTGDERGVTRTVSVTVTDGKGGSDTFATEITIEENVAPEANEIVAAKTTLSAGETIELSVSATDADEDELTYEWTAPEGWSVDGSSATVNVTAPHAFEQTAEISVKISDAHGGTATASITLTTGENTPPTITSAAPTETLRAGRSLFTYEATATDDDGAEIAFSLVDAPEGAVVDAVSGLVRWAPTRQQAGTTTFALAASDGDDSAEETIELTVAPFALIAGEENVDASAGELATGFLNGDAIPDVVVGSRSSTAIKVFAGATGGTFTTGAALALPAGCVAAIAVGDVTGDGEQDIVAANGCIPGAVSVFEGDGQGAFTEPVTTPIGFTGGLLGLALVDFDGDDDLDLAVTGADNAGANNAFKLFANDGEGVFTAASSLPILCAGRIAAGDLSATAGVEFAIADRCTGGVHLVAQGLESTLTEFQFVALETAPAASCNVVPAVGDLDGDDRLDVMVALGCDGRVVPLLREASGVFAEGNTTNAQSFGAGNGFSLVDLDHDGELDVALAYDGTTAACTVAFGEGDGSFTAPITAAADGVQKTISVATGDFDSDGFDDVAVVGVGGLVAFH